MRFMLSVFFFFFECYNAEEHSERSQTFLLSASFFFNFVTRLYSLNDAISSFGFYGLPCLISRNLFLDLSGVQTYFFVSFIVEFFLYLLFSFVTKQRHRVSVVLLRYLSKLRDFYILNAQV